MRLKLRGYLKRSAKLGADPAGLRASTRAHLAQLLANVGEHEDLEDTRRLIDADAVRFEKANAARMKDDHSAMHELGTDADAAAARLRGSVCMRVEASVPFAFARDELSPFLGRMERGDALEKISTFVCDQLLKSPNDFASISHLSCRRDPTARLF